MGTNSDAVDNINEDKKLKKEKNIISDDNIVTMPDLNILQKLRRDKFAKNSEINAQYLSEDKKSNDDIIRKMLKFKRKNMFGLASPRWDTGFFHDNETHFQVPGPAYYEPRIMTNKKSFNLNKKDFIYTNSVPYQSVNGSIIPSNEFFSYNK